MSAVERYRLLLAPLLPRILAEDYRAGLLTDVELEQVVRGRGLPEETIAEVKNGKVDEVEPKNRIILPGDVANDYGTTRSKASQPGAVRGSSPIFGAQDRSIPATVHAELDQGLLTGGTRWKPRRILCSERRGGERIEHVVKLARDPASAAALISEWIGGGLLRAGGVAALDPRLVVIGRDFEETNRRLGRDLPRIPPGVHFGTAFRADVDPVPEKIAVTELADPQQLVDIWVFDTWLCNIDRNAQGNLLATREEGKRSAQRAERAESGARALPERDPREGLSLIAADQSDLFGGNTGLTDGTWKKIMRERGPAPSIACLNQAIMRAGGAVALERARAKVEAALGELDAILADVPLFWFELSGLHREELRTALRDRRLHLDRILAIDHWRKMPT